MVVYSGKDDFICNYLGGKEWVESTKWSGQARILSSSKDMYIHTHTPSRLCIYATDTLFGFGDRSIPREVSVLFG